MENMTPLPEDNPRKFWEFSRRFIVIMIQPLPFVTEITLTPILLISNKNETFNEPSFFPNGMVIHGTTVF